MSDSENWKIPDVAGAVPLGSRGKIRDLGSRLNGTLSSMNETSKRIEETAGWVAVTLVCVAVVSIAALGLAVIALIGSRRSGD